MPNTPSSPRQVGQDPNPPRSHSITISPNAALSPRALPPPPPPHLQHRGSSAHGRSFRDDPETARQRQMQQDIESAMSMCELFSWTSVPSHEDDGECVY